jgi:ribosome-binding protein aMBF1 (putative translation factor)
MTTVPNDGAEDREREIARLRKAIELSGLSDRQFAQKVLVRDERTIRRWIAGDRPIPQAVRAKIDELLGE